MSGNRCENLLNSFYIFHPIHAGIFLSDRKPFFYSCMTIFVLAGPMKKLRKLHVFLVTLLLGGSIMSFRLFDGHFSTESIHEWALDSLFVAAILGFIAVKWLKRKGKLD